MKILILGATGRTGRLIVEEALKQGYDLNVLVTIAMQGCDLVISALGTVKASNYGFAPFVCL